MQFSNVFISLVYHYSYRDNKFSVPVFVNLMHAAVLTGSELPQINFNSHDHDLAMHNFLASYK